MKQILHMVELACWVHGGLLYCCLSFYLHLKFFTLSV